MAHADCFGSIALLSLAGRFNSNRRTPLAAVPRIALFDVIHGHVWYKFGYGGWRTRVGLLLTLLGTLEWNRIVVSHDSKVIAFVL